jgi:hypothetical protein
VKLPWWVVALLMLGVAVGLALILRNLFPKTVASTPRIRTVYVTVPSGKIDTLWRVKLQRDARAEWERDSLRTLLERLTTTLPETVYVAPRVSGMLAFHAGEKVGDSTLVGGFTLEPLDSGYTRRDWLAQFYTAGPVRSLVVDSGVPRITFYPPVFPCGRWCSIKKYLLGGSVGLGTGLLACTLQ